MVQIELVNHLLLMNKWILLNRIISLNNAWNYLRNRIINVETEFKQIFYIISNVKTND